MNDENQASQANQPKIPLNLSAPAAAQMSGVFVAIDPEGKYPCQAIPLAEVIGRIPGEALRQAVAAAAAEGGALFRTASIGELTEVLDKYGWVALNI